MIPPRALLLLAPLALLLPACGGSGDGAGGAPASNPSATPSSSGASEGASAAGSAGSEGAARRDRSGGVPEAELLEPTAYASETFGALHGVVRFDGDPPERFPLGARQKPECCTFPDVEHMSDVAIVNDGKVQYVFVYLKSGYDEAAIPPAPAADVVMDQRGCMYLPHVVALQTGQRLIVKNSDPTNHNVNASAPRNNVQKNRNMGPGQEPLVFDGFERTEHLIRLKCDIHPWMEARVHVQDHPWFAVTDAQGAFEIPDVPPGEYVVEAIHERFGKTSARVQVTAGSSTGFALTLHD